MAGGFPQTGKVPVDAVAQPSPELPLPSFYVLFRLGVFLHPVDGRIVTWTRVTHLISFCC